MVKTKKAIECQKYLEKTGFEVKGRWKSPRRSPKQSLKKSVSRKSSPRSPKFQKAVEQILNGTYRILRSSLKKKSPKRRSPQKSVSFSKNLVRSKLISPRFKKRSSPKKSRK